MNTDDYRRCLQAEIERLHNCRAVHLRIDPVHVVFRGKTIWPPEVEVFVLHRKDELPRVPDSHFAELAYAWGTLAAHFGSNEFLPGLTRFVVVLGFPPVDSAQKAVETEFVKSEKKLRELTTAFHKAMDEQFSTPFPSTN